MEKKVAAASKWWEPQVKIEEGAEDDSRRSRSRSGSRDTGISDFPRDKIKIEPVWYSGAEPRPEMDWTPWLPLLYAVSVEGEIDDDISEIDEVLEKWSRKELFRARPSKSDK